MHTKFPPQTLRKLADELLVKMTQDQDFPGEFPKDFPNDFATSLVRQWLTYDGHATFFFDDMQVFLKLARSPLGKPHIISEPTTSDWIKQLQDEWKISGDELDEVFDQLNRGQSAEVVNSEGVPLRL